MMKTEWVEALLGRLSVRYGASFMRQYEGVESRLVIGDWAVALAGFGPDHIKHALTILPADWPPNAMQFRDLCKKMPEKFAAPQLEAPKADPDRVRKILAGMTDKQVQANPAAQCLRNISAAADRAMLTAGQRWVRECCETMIR